MRTLYLDCSMGAAGDMLTAALCELIDDRDGFFEELGRLLPEGVVSSAETVSKLGVCGTSPLSTVAAAFCVSASAAFKS